MPPIKHGQASTIPGIPDHATHKLSRHGPAVHRLAGSHANGELPSRVPRQATGPALPWRTVHGEDPQQSQDHARHSISIAQGFAAAATVPAITILACSRAKRFGRGGRSWSLAPVLIILV
jgi:hypothetical protein